MKFLRRLTKRISLENNQMRPMLGVHQQENQTKNFSRINSHRKINMFKQKVKMPPTPSSSSQKINQSGKQLKVQSIFENLLQQIQPTQKIQTKQQFKLQNILERPQQIERISQKPIILNRQGQLYEQMTIKGTHGKMSPYFQQLVNSQTPQPTDEWKQKSIVKRLKLQGNPQDIPMTNSMIGSILKIMTWNINGGRDELPFLRKQRLKQIVQEIKSTDADFILLQEASLLYCPNQRRKFNEDFFEPLKSSLSGEKYYVAQINTSEQQNIYASKSFHRTIIISKIPVQFYEIGFTRYFSNFMTMCEFSINIKGKDYSTLLASIHLKARSKEFRETQSRFKYLQQFKQMSQHFQISILAGDFNIGQTPAYPQNRMLTSYKDIDYFFHDEQKRPTYGPLKKPKKYRFDRILFDIKNPELKAKFRAEPRVIGDDYLSDHLGRCAYIMFAK